MFDNRLIDAKACSGLVQHFNPDCYRLGAELSQKIILADGVELLMDIRIFSRQFFKIFNMRSAIIL